MCFLTKGIMYTNLFISKSIRILILEQNNIKNV